MNAKMKMSTWTTTVFAITVFFYTTLFARQSTINTVVLLGENISLTCGNESSNGSIKWKFKPLRRSIYEEVVADRRHNIALIHERHYLFIQAANQSDAGLYCCEDSKTKTDLYLVVINRIPDCCADIVQINNTSKMNTSCSFDYHGIDRISISVSVYSEHNIISHFYMTVFNGSAVGHVLSPPSNVTSIGFRFSHRSSDENIAKDIPEYVLPFNQPLHSMGRVFDGSGKDCAVGKDWNVGVDTTHAFTSQSIDVPTSASTDVPVQVVASKDHNSKLSAVLDTAGISRKPLLVVLAVFFAVIGTTVIVVFGIYLCKEDNRGNN